MPYKFLPAVLRQSYEHICLFMPNRDLHLEVLVTLQALARAIGVRILYFRAGDLVLVVVVLLTSPSPPDALRRDFRRVLVTWTY